MTKPLTPTEKQAIFAPYRDQIDAIDQNIMALLGKRFNIVREVGVIKADHGLKLFQTARVDQVLANITILATDNNLSVERMRHIYTQLIDYAHEIEGHIKEDRS